MINQFKAIVRNLIGVKNTSVLHKIFPFHVNRLNKTKPIRSLLVFVREARKILVDENKEGFFDHLVKNGINASKLPDDWWDDFFYFIQSERKSEEERFIIATENLASELLEAEDWLKLYAVCVFMGLFNIGFKIREKAKQAPYKNPLLEVSTFLDDNEIDKAIKSIQSLKSLSVEDKEKLSTLVSIIRGSHGMTQSYSGELSKLLKGKKVALVGPVKGQENTAKEIDSSDIIVRLNYVESGKGCDDECLGLKTDLAYFNGVSCQILKEKYNGNLPSEIKFGVFKGDTYFPDLKPKSKLKVVTSYNRFLLTGSYNLIQYAILDILKYEPGSVKIYGTDLMLSPNRYKGYAVQKNLKDNALAFLPHEPVAQYNLLRNLYKNKVVDVDSRLKEVLELGTENYMDGIQEIYGKALKLDYK
ncbi:MAG: hypothetical protein ACPGRC_03970 [Salibacteraceae bacterium]